jgi:hypothetical protein
MANEAAKVKWSEQDISDFIGELDKGIYCALGRTRRGPVGKAVKVSGWPMYKRTFGSLLTNSDFPLIVKQALDVGATLWIARATHFTDITNESDNTATAGTLTLQDSNVFAAPTTAPTAATAATGGTLAPGVYKFQQTFLYPSGETTAGPEASFTIPSGTSTNTLTITGSVVPSTATAVKNYLTAPGRATGTELLAGQYTTGTTLVVTAPAAGAALPTTNTTSNPAATIALSLKDPGSFSANCTAVVVVNAQDPTKFDLNLLFSEDVSLNESYRYLSMDSTDLNNYFGNVIGTKSWMYNAVDSASPASTFALKMPLPGTYTFSTGNDGTAGLDETDYIGDSSTTTGLHSFDEVEDAFGIAVPEIGTRTMIAAGDAYCVTRGDLFYISETPIGLNDAQIAAFKMGQTPYSGAAFNSSFHAMFSGHMEVNDPNTNRQKFISNAGHVIGVHASSDANNEPWFAAAGLERGKVRGVTQIDYNMGSNARKPNLDAVVKAQVNPFVSFPADGIILWGNKTTQVQESALQNLHVRKLLLYMQKMLLPANRISLFNPNDPTEWKRIYMRCKPVMEKLVTGRGIYDYLYQGDQGASKLSDVVVNNPTDLQNGIYVVKIYIHPINVIEVLEFQAIITADSVAFSAVAAQ